MMQFTHLLLEAKSKYSQNLKPYSKTHDILGSVDGFSQISLNYKLFPPIRIKTKPMIFILKRKSALEAVMPEALVEEAVAMEPEILDEVVQEESMEVITKENLEASKSEVNEIDSSPEEVKPLEVQNTKKEDSLESLGSDILDDDILNELKHLDEMYGVEDAEAERVKQSILRILREYKNQKDILEGQKAVMPENEEKIPNDAVQEINNLNETKGENMADQINLSNHSH